mgnify:CR=1 FL=1
MNKVRQYLAPLTASVMILSFNHCSNVWATHWEDQPLGGAAVPVSSDAFTSSGADQPAGILPPKLPMRGQVAPAPGGTNAPMDRVGVIIYRVDRQCQTLVGSPTEVSRTTALEMTIRQILQQPNLTEVPLMYRVEVDPQRQAVTIDFRVPPQSHQRITSLSVCEQLAIFGSLRQTLLKNPQLRVNQVYFTERGREIAL